MNPEVSRVQKAYLAAFTPEQKELLIKLRGAVLNWWKSESKNMTGEQLRTEAVLLTLDKAIVTLLKPIAKASLLEQPYKSLSDYMRIQYDPFSHKKDDAPENIQEAVVVDRMMETEFMLEQHRLYQAGLNKTIEIEGVSMKRTYPWWGIESLQGLDTEEKAKAYYRCELAKRGLIK
jgi:hypothetical protein